MSAITFEQLVDRFEDLERRVAALESGVRYQPTPPPPVQRTEPAVKPEVRPTPLPMPAYVPPQEDAEYFLGAKVLPRVGAALLILAIGYLVRLGVTSGILGPWSLFGFACVVCVGFIAVGQCHREEREQFGHLLTGVGACGLYITFAAGHVVQGLYRGEVLVGLFLTLSFVNLGYSLWRASTAFLAIGVLGGFIAAVMPLREQNFLVASVLHGMILLLAAGIVGYRRWSDAILGVAFAAIFAALPLTYGWPASRWYGVALLYLSAAAVTAAWCRIRKEDEGEVPPSAAGLILFVTAVLAFLAQGGAQGSYHVLAGSAVVALLGLALAEQADTRIGVAVGAALAGLILAPLGLPPSQSLFAYPVLALACAAIAFFAGPYVAAIAGVTFTASVVRYVWLITPHGLTFADETRYLALAAAAAIVVGLSARNRDAEAFGTGAAVLAIGRLAYLVLIGSLGVVPNEAATAVMIFGSLLSLALGFLRDLPGLRYASFFGLSATVVKVLLVDLAATEPAVKVVILMALGLAMVGGGYWYIQHRRAEEKKTVT